MTNNFKTFFSRKFGASITDRLFVDGRINVEAIQRKNLEDQALVRMQLESLDSSLNLKLFPNQMQWAFDFPGFTGVLQDRADSKRKYMVVGLEPHIADFDFQITYGLSEVTPIDRTKRFSIDVNKSDFIRCKNDSDIIWSNLFKLFADEATFEAVYKNQDQNALDSFLDNFYITDLCHFAPQGAANLINQIANWQNIRSVIAREFLADEIALVNPEIITTQGETVFCAVADIVKPRQLKTETISVGKQLQTQDWHWRNRDDIVPSTHRKPDDQQNVLEKESW